MPSGHQTGGHPSTCLTAEWYGVMQEVTLVKQGSALLLSGWVTACLMPHRDTCSKEKSKEHTSLWVDWPEPLRRNCGFDAPATLAK